MNADVIHGLTNVPIRNTLWLFIPRINRAAAMFGFIAAISFALTYAIRLSANFLLHLLFAGFFFWATEMYYILHSILTAVEVWNELKIEAVVFPLEMCVIVSLLFWLPKSLASNCCGLTHDASVVVKARVSTWTHFVFQRRVHHTIIYFVINVLLYCRVGVGLETLIISVTWLWF